MVYDLNDTIAAIGTATGGAVRGMVRLSGPRVLDCLGACFQPASAIAQLISVQAPSVYSGKVTAQFSSSLPCDLFLWPNERSYTRQPTAELHTLGSPPLLEQLLRSVCDSGARLAEPGEFTLRAFLAGRLDLTQAEAVLGVIDAHSSTELSTALTQLAGGLSQPLSKLREQLLGLLAELEAGLDFAEEDIEFISAAELHRQIISAQAIVAEVAAQLSSREDTGDLPRIVLSGPPNAGKSSLFNALVERFGCTSTHALVSNQSGTTRDFVTAIISLRGLACELVDTAGVESVLASDSIDQIAQAMTSKQRQQADLVVQCQETLSSSWCEHELPAKQDHTLVVQTKSDLFSPKLPSTHSKLACSSVSGAGLAQLAELFYQRVSTTARETRSSPALTARRCSGSLQQAQHSLSQAVNIVAVQGGEELVAAEIREALHALGQVVGVVYTDDILDRIFGQFCIGK